MKKTLFALSLLSALLITGCNGSSSSYGGELLQPTNVYEVDGWGSNPDIYEFTPVDHEHMTCLILVSGSDASGGLHCFPKINNKTL